MSAGINLEFQFITDLGKEAKTCIMVAAQESQVEPDEHVAQPSHASWKQPVNIVWRFIFDNIESANPDSASADLLWNASVKTRTNCEIYEYTAYMTSVLVAQSIKHPPG